MGAGGDAVLLRKKKAVAPTGEARSSCSLVFWGVFGAVIVLSLTRAFTTGNPNQHVERLFKIMRDGIVRARVCGVSQCMCTLETHPLHARAPVPPGWW